MATLSFVCILAIMSLSLIYSSDSQGDVSDSGDNKDTITVKNDGDLEKVKNKENVIIDGNVKLKNTTFDKDVLKTIEFTKNAADVNIPAGLFKDFTKLESVKGYPAEKIPAIIFKNCANLSEFTLGENVIINEWGACSFEGVKKLNTISICGKTTVVASAFKDANIQKLNLSGTIIWRGTITGLDIGELCYETENDEIVPNNTPFKNVTVDTIIIKKDLSSYIFSGVKCSNIVVEPELISIGNYSFQDCTTITSFDFSKVKTIGTGAFSGCVNLGCNTEKEIDLSKVSKIDSSAFSGCKSLKGQVKLSSYEGNEISPGMFKDCTSIEEVQLPANVSAIGNNAFAGCTSLEKFDFSEIKKIGIKSFENCKQLSKDNDTLQLSDVESIYGDSFNGCGYKEIELSQNCQVMNYSANKDNIVIDITK